MRSAGVSSCCGDLVSPLVRLMRTMSPDGLQSILENRLRQKGEVPGFDERLFRKVWRAPEFTNVDGRHPAKKPDLVFELVRDEMLVLSTHDALFVECKLVGNTHPVGTKYCNKGISRFIEGDYGWAMQEGMMLAYARHGYTLAGNLAKVLVSEPYHTGLGQPTSLELVPGMWCTPTCGKSTCYRP